MASQTMPPPDYGPANSTLAPPDDGAYTTFYDALAPYGTWVDVGGYGPCWQPTVVVGNPYWQPYCNGGRWVYTDCGWYWLSSYSWGWAPFHYGRWFRHDRLGWCWAPDAVWGPSWVCWRYGTDYCGWAPLPPGAWYRAGVGLTYRGQPVGNTFGFGLGVSSFAVVPFSHFWDQHLPRYALPQKQASQALSRTVVSASIVNSNNRMINNGLPPSRVIASTGLGIRRVAVHDAYGASVHGVRAERLEAGGTTLSAFRPNLSPRAGTQPAAAGWANRSAGQNTGAGLAVPGASYGTSYSGLSAGGNGRTVVTTEITPSGALIVTGRKERGNIYQRPPTQRSESPDWQQPASPASSAPQPAPVERHYSAPSYQAPEMSRAASAPAYTPPHTYSPPPPSYTPRPEVTEPGPTYSPPPAPAAPAHSAPDRYGR